MNQSQFQQQDENDGFIILQALTPEEQAIIKAERLQELTQFYTTNKQYEISSWYPALQPFTFSSCPTQLTAIDAYVLYWLYYNDRDLTKMQLEHQQLFKYYTQLVQKIDAFLVGHCKQFQTEGKPHCFMKLATRSPKDLGYKYSAQEIDQVAQQLAHYLKDKHPKHTEMTDHLSLEFVNSIYRFFLDLSKQKFRISSGYNFIQNFSSSQRIIIDIADFSFLKNDVFGQFEKNQYERAQQLFIQLWAREWKEFKWYEELRCFYHDYQLTAITQYDQRCFFEELQDREELVRKEVGSFFELLKPELKKVGLSEGVMDLVVFNLGEGKQVKLKLIEINVFNRNSRASLFFWDRDYDILTGKQLQQPQLRVLAAPKLISKDQVKRLMGMIEKGTDKIIEKALDSLGLKPLWEKHQ